ncbi:MAG: AAA family ATPase, partial [Nitrospirae bacterium]
QNVRKALAIAEAIAPCVLWLDEIEKAIGGHASSAATDSGVTLGMVGTLLTWMQEFTGQVLVMATCNDYQKLPAEFTRAGRFDERFFVDLPSNDERLEIATIHLRRYLEKDQAESFAQLLVPLTNRWTGAEIEQCVKSAARRTRKHLTDGALKEAAASIRPLAQTKGPEIDALRQWAHDTLRMANAAPIMIPHSGRKLRHA